MEPLVGWPTRSAAKAWAETMAIMVAAPAVAVSRLMLKELGFIFLMALTAEGAGHFASQLRERRRAGPSANRLDQRPAR
jgi:hypothetical protein